MGQEGMLHVKGDYKESVQWEGGVYGTSGCTRKSCS